ncbi:MAG TPA: CAP domain-containing protein [Anaeromyxobacter sp.]
MRLRHAAAAVALAAWALSVTAFAAIPPPSAAADARYGPEPRATPSALEARVLAQARSRLRPAPRTSPALVLAARELAGRAAAGEPDPIARGHLRGALARAVAYDPSPAAVLLVAAPEAAAAAVARALPRESASDIGAGAVERDGKAWVVLLLSDRKARLDPFPREVTPGARAVLSGALGSPLSRPRVFVTRPTGEVVDAGGSAGRGFRIPIDFAAPGRHVVEVVGEGEAGPEVAAILAVAVGGAALDPAPAAARAPEPEDRAEAEAGVLRALNATRRRRGLAPVQASAELASVARRHAEAMAAAGQVAHVVPGSGEAGGRLRRAGVPYRHAFENVARAGTALEAHQAAEESPAHLANVLRPEASQAGIGIARARLPSGDRSVYLAEILVEPPDDGAGSRLTPEARIREALWRERARLGLAPLTSDPALDAIARDAAIAMRTRDEPEADGLGERALALRRNVAAVDVFVASGPDEAARSANVRDPRFARVGVGLASGNSVRFGKGRLWIAVVYTD